MRKAKQSSEWRFSWWKCFVFEWRMAKPVWGDMMATVVTIVNRKASQNHHKKSILEADELQWQEITSGSTPVSQKQEESEATVHGTRVDFWKEESIAQSFPNMMWSFAVVAQYLYIYLVRYLLSI